jgi:antitoxin (DNA-binding transcriptional repressor) of toxin-antitoxin stability system
VFKDTCLHLLDQVNEGAFEVVVTKHGTPVARVVPEGGNRLSAHGFMSGTVLQQGDIVSPRSGRLRADAGRWFRVPPVARRGARRHAGARLDEAAPARGAAAVSLVNDRSAACLRRRGGVRPLGARAARSGGWSLLSVAAPLRAGAGSRRDGEAADDRRGHGLEAPRAVAELAEVVFPPAIGRTAGQQGARVEMARA